MARQVWLYKPAVWTLKVGHTRAFLCLQLLQASATLRLLRGRPATEDDGAFSSLNARVSSDGKARGCSASGVSGVMAGDPARGATAESGSHLVGDKYVMRKDFKSKIVPRVYTRSSKASVTGWRPG